MQYIIVNDIYFDECLESQLMSEIDDYERRTFDHLDCYIDLAFKLTEKSVFYDENGNRISYDKSKIFENIWCKQVYVKQRWWDKLMWWIYDMMNGDEDFVEKFNKMNLREDVLFTVFECHNEEEVDLIEHASSSSYNLPLYVDELERDNDWKKLIEEKYLELRRFVWKKCPLSSISEQKSLRTTFSQETLFQPLYFKNLNNSDEASNLTNNANGENALINANTFIALLLDENDKCSRSNVEYNVFIAQEIFANFNCWCKFITTDESCEYEEYYEKSDLDKDDGEKFNKRVYSRRLLDIIVEVDYKEKDALIKALKGEDDENMKLIKPYSSSFVPFKELGYRVIEVPNGNRDDNWKEYFKKLRGPKIP